MQPSLLKACVAELIGTFTLIFAGVLAIQGAAIAGAPEGIANLASIGLAHGLAIAVMVAALGAISGGHFNPAVTFGFVITGRMAPAKGAAYWAAQILGAYLAGLIIALTFGAKIVAGGTPDLGTGITVAQGIVVEAVTTFFLVLVVFGSAVDARAPKSVYPFAIGFTVALDIMAIGPISGAAMNPARFFGPALASGHFDHAIVYVIGPLVGGGLAAAIQSFFLIEPAPVAPSERGGPTVEEERG